MQDPPRKDIIKFYMETAHPILCTTLKTTWLHQALDFSVLETIQLIEWSESYANDLKTFGIKDDSLNNGIKTLRCGYSRKIHIQITPLLLNIIRNERQLEPDFDDKGYLCTNSPKDFHGIFTEMLEVPIAKRMKELVLEVLRVLKQVSL